MFGFKAGMAIAVTALVSLGAYYSTSAQDNAVIQKDSWMFIGDEIIAASWDADYFDLPVSIGGYFDNAIRSHPDKFNRTNGEVKEIDYAGINATMSKTGDQPIPRDDIYK
jgi:hypothetical protein